MEKREFYDIFYDDMVSMKEEVITIINDISSEENDIVEYCISRIKSPRSVMEKLEKKNLPLTSRTALENLKDIIAVRIICKFLNDVYVMVERIKTSPSVVILKEKDYIANPKENGYRTYHLIVKLTIETSIDIPIEIQIRTIAQDSWASLEHKMKYKKHIPNQKMIQSELKRCADEIASTDITMQTIQELIEMSE